MSQEEIFINGELLRLSREARGWVINDMATRACMSVKQIRQLEEGGMSAFYSAAVKATSAKKVGSLLGLSADQVFSQTEAPVETEVAIEPAAFIDQASVEPSLVSAEPPIAKSEDSVDPVIDAVAQAPVATTVVLDRVQPPLDDTPSSKNSLWMIVVLLALALALGAFFQPQEEPVVAEPVPPIQVLPIDAPDPAGAASAADSVASSVEVAVIQASAPVVSPVASVARVVVSTASAASASAPRASTPTAVSAPAASAAVKAP